MLFDKAQGLMVGADNAGHEGLLFQCIHWRLCLERKMTEFESVVRYGWPLSTHYQQSGTSMNGVAKIIECLLLLSGSCYAEDPPACLSVLSS